MLQQIDSIAMQLCPILYSNFDNANLLLKQYNGYMKHHENIPNFTCRRKNFPLNRNVLNIASGHKSTQSGLATSLNCTNDTFIRIFHYCCLLVITSQIAKCANVSRFPCIGMMRFWHNKNCGNQVSILCHCFDCCHQGWRSIATLPQPAWNRTIYPLLHCKIHHRHGRSVRGSTANDGGISPRREKTHAGWRLQNRACNGGTIEGISLLFRSCLWRNLWQCAEPGSQITSWWCYRRI